VAFGIKAIGSQRQRQQFKVNKNQTADLLFQYMPCIAKAISPEYELLMINNETIQVMKIQEQGLIGKKCYDAFGNGMVCSGCPVPRVLESKQVCTANNKMHMFNSTKFYMNQTVMPILNRDGSMKYIIEMSVDITKRKILEKMNHCMFIETVSSLAKLIDSRDHSTGTHSERVREIALSIGNYLNLAESELQELSVAAILHDIGKIGIPEAILHKTEKLSVEEFSIIKRHVQIGYDALKNINLLRKTAEYVRFHHEVVDGSGYPCKLSGEKIPLISRILCVADVYEALTADRVYRKAMSHEQALAIMREGAGKQFDTKVLHAFFESRSGTGIL
jgi:HD-GYP domain-containing protein (c-di-GMP phosphodiesterase class II)